MAPQHSVPQMLNLTRFKACLWRLVWGTLYLDEQNQMWFFELCSFFNTTDAVFFRRGGGGKIIARLRQMQTPCMNEMIMWKIWEFCIEFSQSAFCIDCQKIIHSTHRLSTSKFHFWKSFPVRFLLGFNYCLTKQKMLWKLLQFLCRTCPLHYTIAALKLQQGNCNVLKTHQSSKAVSKN